MAGELSQAPEQAQNASFLQKDSAFKILVSGTATSPALGVGALTGTNVENPAPTISITHNLGFMPFAMVFEVNSAAPTQANPLPTFKDFTVASYALQPGLYIYFATSTTTLDIVFLNPNTTEPAGTHTFKYYLFDIPVV